MREKITFTTILIIIIACIVILVQKRDTNIYLSLAGYYPYDRIDMRIDIDGERIFSDTVIYSAFIPDKISRSMRLGFHQISVESNSLNIREDKTIFLFFNQYIIIEFYNKVELIRDSPEFSIRTNSNPYYIE